MRRSATWSILAAVLLTTVAAAGLGYLIVQLFLLPETLAEQRLNLVPDLAGRELESGRDRADEQGYTVVESGRLSSEEVEAGRIIYQIPPPGFHLPRGDTIHVAISRGPDRTVVPRLEGLEADLATSILRRLGLKVTPPREEFSNVHPLGAVTGTVPPAGTVVSPGTSVTPILSAGGSFLAMPNVRGLSLAAARDTLEMHSLTVGQIVHVRGDPAASDQVRVVVSGQRPAPGERVRRGSAVRLDLGEREDVRF